MCVGGECTLKSNDGNENENENKKGMSNDIPFVLYI
jgi:hypothetical protein